ncbi:MAG: Plug domain-containing protein, partial [Holophagales bacterium]|nr:Plug domain-containing protein [Holophagales bacterium]
MFPAALPLALLLATLAALPAVAETDAGSQAATQDSEPSRAPKAVVEEEVDVEGTAPQIPALSGIQARLPMDPLETPASLSEVGHAVLTEQTALTLSDALQNLAGVNVQTGSGTFDNFWVRGFESVAGVLVLVDGAFDPESSFLHLYNVDRVEMVRGSAG